MAAPFGPFLLTVTAKEDFDATINVQEGVVPADKDFTGWTDFFGALGATKIEDAPLVMLVVTVILPATDGDLRLQADSSLTQVLQDHNDKKTRTVDIFGIDPTGDLKLVAQGTYEIRKTATRNFVP